MLDVRESHLGGVREQWSFEWNDVVKDCVSRIELETLKTLFSLDYPANLGELSSSLTVVLGIRDSFIKSLLDVRCLNYLCWTFKFFSFHSNHHSHHLHT